MTESVEAPPALDGTAMVYLSANGDAGEPETCDWSTVCDTGWTSAAATCGVDSDATAAPPSEDVKAITAAPTSKATFCFFMGTFQGTVLSEPCEGCDTHASHVYDKTVIHM